MIRLSLMITLLALLVACASATTSSSDKNLPQEKAPAGSVGQSTPASTKPEDSSPQEKAPAGNVVQSTPDPPATAIPEATPAPVITDSAGRPARPAPEITNDVWINSAAPVRLADLRAQGRVTLVEFWTYGCYNCRNVLPALKAWDARYRDQGLTIIGVHFPEFERERKLENVQAAVIEHEIKYPVTLDNDGVTWNAYAQHYWPTLYLVDKAGLIRFIHIGEGAYEETEKWIQTLLAEEAAALP